MKKLIKRQDNCYVLEHDLPIIIFSSFEVMDIYENSGSRISLRKDQVVFTKLLGQSEYEFLLGLIENFVNTFDGKRFIINDELFEFHKGRGLNQFFSFNDYFNHQEQLIEIGHKYNKMSNIIKTILKNYEKEKAD